MSRFFREIHQKIGILWKWWKIGRCIINGINVDGAEIFVLVEI